MKQWVEVFLKHLPFEIIRALLIQKHRKGDALRFESGEGQGVCPGVGRT